MTLRPAFRLLSALMGSLAIALPALAAPVTVEDLVRSALDEHPSLAAAQETVNAQAARARGATAPYWPQASLNSSVAQTTQVSQAQNTAQPFNLMSGGLNVRQQIWDFGKTAEEVAAAEAATEASRYQASLQGVEVAYGVRRSYLEWLRATGLETQAKARLASAEALHRQAVAFWQAGRKPKIDVTRAEATVQQAKADLIAATNAVATAKLSLGAAIGRSTPVEGEPALPAVPPQATMTPEALQARIATHPNLLAADARIEQAQAQARRAAKAYWPDLNADANYGLRARDLSPSQNWSANVSATIPLFRGFSEAREQEAAEAQERASQATKAEARLRLSTDVARARLAVHGAHERLAAVEAAWKSAEENHALAEGRYRAGVGSVIEVSDAQLLVANAQAERVRAQTDYHLAIADLLRALGLTGVES